MDIIEAVEKLKEAGFYAKPYYNGNQIRGGTHRTWVYLGWMVHGSFFINPENNPVKIKTTNELTTSEQTMTSVFKDSLEEAVQYLIDNVKPGISDEPPKREPTEGPCNY
jgi:hypothetical protein